MGCESGSDDDVAVRWRVYAEDVSGHRHLPRRNVSLLPRDSPYYTSVGLFLVRNLDSALDVQRDVVVLMRGRI